MERGAALSKIRKLLGKNFNYRVNPKAPNAEEKTELRSEYLRAREKTSELEKRMQARRRELLDADEEFKTLETAYRAARKRQSDLAGGQHSYRFSVGVPSGMFNFIKAEGDSWEEVIEKLQGKKKPKVAETTDIPNSEIFGNI